MVERLLSSWYKLRTILPIFLAVFASNCNGFTLAIRQFQQKQELQPQLQHGIEINLFSDFHYVGTKDQNLVQLKYFVEHILTSKPMHLIIETQFFYGINYKEISATSALGYLSHKFKEDYSFTNSAQKPEATTWIAWELPLILLSIYHNEKLPHFIELTDNQKFFIQNNVSCDFSDPRMYIDNNYSLLEELIAAKDFVIKKFNHAVENSPIRIASVIPRYVASRLEKGEKDPTHDLFCAEYFDIEVLTSIINSICLKKPIMVLCGDFHVQKLKTILPHLFDDPNINLLACAKADISPNEVRWFTENALHMATCKNMSDIISGALRGKAQHATSPHGSPTNNSQQNRSPRKHDAEKSLQSTLNLQSSVMQRR